MKRCIAILLIFGLLIGLAGCGSKETDATRAELEEKLAELETENAELTATEEKEINDEIQVQQEKKEVDRSNVVAEEYIDAVKWILNPNAGPVYWEETYPEYEKYISRKMVDDKIQEYVEAGKVDVSSTGMTEPEYNMREVFKYPAYDEGQGIYESYNSYEKEMTLSYEEFIQQEYNDHRYFDFYVTQDREYLAFSGMSHTYGKEDALKSLEESFKKPVWLLEVSKDNSHKVTGIIELVDTGTYEHYIGRLGVYLNMGETEYECYLDDENRIEKIEKFMYESGANSDNEDEVLFIGTTLGGYEEYDPSKGDDYYLEKQGLKSEDATSEEAAREESISDFDKLFYDKNGKYPDENVIQRRIVANDTIMEMYNLQELEQSLLEAAKEYCEYPVLTALNDYGDYLLLNMSNYFFKAVYGDEPEYNEWVVLVHVDGRYKAVFVPTFDFEKGFDQ